MSGPGPVLEELRAQGHLDLARNEGDLTPRVKRET